MARLGPGGPSGAGHGARSRRRSAVQDGAEALVVDLAGPVSFVVEGDDLRGLAAGWRLVAGLGCGRGWIRPDAESSASLQC